jgi:F0F1-type ATP synthase assembly protein I
VTEPGKNGQQPLKKSPWAYLSLGLEFAATVGLLTWAGWWADQRWGYKPWGTVAGSMLGVALAMYRLIRETVQ